MNTKEFRRRWVRSKIEPELFYMPIGKKEKEEFIFEVENVTEIKWSSGATYSIYGQSTKPTLNKNDENNPLYQYLPKDNNVFYHFSFDKISDDDTKSEQNRLYYYQARLFEQFKDEEGKYITKDTYPELFTDWSIHNLRDNLLSENMIIPNNAKFTVNWGDGSSDTFEYTDERFLWDNIEINGKEYRMFRGYNSKLTCHTYAKKGTYIIKITGFLPCLSLPEGTTRIINWGNIGLRFFPDFNLCRNTFKDLGIIKNLDNMVFMNGVSLGLCINTYYNTENFKFCKDLKSLVFAQNLICLERLSSPLNGLLSNCPYLVSAKNIFYSNSYQNQQLNLSGILNRNLGNDILMNCPELRIVKPLFYSNISYDAAYQIQIQIGDNFLRKCPCIWSTEELFYTNNYTSQYKPISNNEQRVQYKCLTDIRQIGAYCLAECNGLTYVSKTFSYVNIENIGEGLFYNNQNIRQASNLFFNCNNLRKVPDKLFYYLKCNPEYVEDYFIFSPLVVRSDIIRSIINIYSINDFENIPKTEIGKKMFNDLFLSSGKIIINSPFVSPINITIRLVNTNGALIYDDCGCPVPAISSSLYYGEVPNLWDYTDNIGKVLVDRIRINNAWIYDYLFVSYNQLFSFDFPEKFLVVNYPATALRPNNNEGFFGRERGMFGIFGSCDSFVNWSNYDSIPKKTKYQYYGQDLTNISDIKQISNISERCNCSYWLTPLMFDDIDLYSALYIYDHEFIVDGNVTNLNGAIEYAVSKNLNIENFILNCKLKQGASIISRGVGSTNVVKRLYERCLINGKPPITISKESRYPLVADIKTMEFGSADFANDGTWEYINTETLDFKLNSCVTYYTIPVDTYNMGRMRCKNYPFIGGKTFGFAIDPYHVNYYEFDTCQNIKLKATINYFPILSDIEKQLVDANYGVNITEVGYYAGYPNVIETISLHYGGSTNHQKNGTFTYGVGSYLMADPGNSIFTLAVNPVDGFYGDYKLEESIGDSSTDYVCSWSYYSSGIELTETDCNMSSFENRSNSTGNIGDDYSIKESINTIYSYKTIAEKMSEYYGEIVEGVCSHYKKFDFNVESSFVGTLGYYDSNSGAYIGSGYAQSGANGSYSKILEIVPRAKYASTDYGVYYTAK